MNAGRLVPDEMVSDVVQWRLEILDWRHGFVLDGFPRSDGTPTPNVVQAEIRRKLGLDKGEADASEASRVAEVTR